ANMPISIQPLDQQGRALQRMPNWMVGMPGETVSCIGCHDQQNGEVPDRRTMAGLRAPSAIEPWYGPARPFAFHHEVQPVLDKFCVGCHNGQPRADGRLLPDLTAETEAAADQDAKSYMALQSYVHRPDPESDYHSMRPMEYHASTSHLVQMLTKGHHNVQPDREAWDRLYAWIDLSAPYRGKWNAPSGRSDDQCSRRVELAKRYANVDADPQSEYDVRHVKLATREPIEPIKPTPLPARKIRVPKVPGWPMTAEQAKTRQAAAAAKSQFLIELADGISLSLTLIPAGQFALGNAYGGPDERPAAAVKIDEPFWIGTLEVTNEQYNLFDEAHDSRHIDMAGKHQGNRGFPANGPKQPVIRVTWQKAIDYCRWLSEQTGRKFSLPTEAQWEWACRAGSATDLWFGSVDADFSKFCNFADAASTQERMNPFPRAEFDDGQNIAGIGGRYQANPWGLHDMHGNVSEWTRSSYRPYPYDAADGRNAVDAPGQFARSVGRTVIDDEHVIVGGQFHECALGRFRSAQGNA
ncbi:hypothetical protein LCGC14_2431760, partial [marine sediment metagenome]